MIICQPKVRHCLYQMRFQLIRKVVQRLIIIQYYKRLLDIINKKPINNLIFPAESIMPVGKNIH